MTKDLETITQMIMSLRPYPDIFRHACIMLGSFFPVVGLDGLPSDPETNRKHSNFSRKDAAWLHRELDKEFDEENRTTKGFLVFLVENKRLWQAMTLLE